MNNNFKLVVLAFGKLVTVKSQLNTKENIKYYQIVLIKFITVLYLTNCFCSNLLLFFIFFKLN